MIVRYIRFRLGDENKPVPSGDDCINTDDVDHVIFDHISASWGIDGNHDLRRGGNFTLQWSIYAEALHDSLHEKGPHAMLASFRDLTAGISLHHNLFASSRERHPTLGGSPDTDPEAIVDFRNNVIYNVQGATNLGNCKINMVNNYFVQGLTLRPITIRWRSRRRIAEQRRRTSPATCSKAQTYSLAIITGAIDFFAGAMAIICGLRLRTFA